MTIPAVPYQPRVFLLRETIGNGRIRRMSGTLYIVATPIGNLEDITQRALRVLREVELIACEDTRRTRTLLNHFGISTKTISYHEHNEIERAKHLVELLESGKDIALVSDAGTPLISDPGFRILNAAINRGLAVVPVPGACAAIAALSASGLASDQFWFRGFLPARSPARRARLQEARAIKWTLIFYEAPHRIVATLKDARDVLGDRDAVVARELTKLHEEIARGTLSELAERFSQAAVRGEIVLLIAGADDTGSEPDQPFTPSSLIERVRELEKTGLDSRAALKKAARELGLKRADAYRQMMTQKNLRNK